MGSILHQVRASDEGSQRTPPKWEQQGQETVEGGREGKGKGDRLLRSGQRAADRRREAVRQALRGKSFLNPTMALDEALRRVAVGDPVDSRQQTGAELERLLLLGRRVDVCAARRAFFFCLA